MKSFKIQRKIKSTILRIKELEVFKGKNVELSIKINELTSNRSSPITKSLAGSLAHYANKNHIENEKNAWTLAVREKHENYRR